MKFWGTIKDKAVMARLADEAFHDAAIEEIRSGKRRDGLWAKAVLLCNGSETQAKLTYLRLLIIALKDESYISGRVSESRQQKRPSPPAQSPTSHESKEQTRESSANEDRALLAVIAVVVVILGVVVALNH